MTVGLMQGRGDLTDDNRALRLTDQAIAWLVAGTPLWLLLGAAPADIAISLVGLLWVWRSYAQRDFSWLRTPWVATGMVLWLYFIGTGLFAAEVDDALRRALPWGRFIIFAAAAARVLGASERLRRATVILTAAVVAFVVGDTLYQFANGVDILGKPSVDGRLTGPMNSLAVGIFLVYVSQPVLAFAMGKASDPLGGMAERAASALAILAVVATVTLSGERMALLLLLLSLAILALLSFRSVKRLVILMAGAAAAALALMLAFPGILARHASTLELTLQPANSIYGRIWTAAFEIFQSNPWTGVGLRNFRSACAAQFGAGSPEATAICGNLHPHQMWLEWLSETGVIGTVGLTLMFGLLIVAALRRRSLWRAEPLILGGLVAVIVKLWPLATAGSFFSNRNAGIFWFLAALLATAIEMPANKTEKSGQ